MIRRYNRKNDFRASGSGLIEHSPNLANMESIQTAFNVSIKLGLQSAAFDFVYDVMGKPKIIEVSYCYAMGPAYDNCQGYWDKDLVWYPDNVNSQQYIIEDFIESINQ